MVLLNNITKSFAIDKQFPVDPRLTLAYTIRDGDRPELLSNRLYGTQDYWWTVLLINNIVEYDKEWPLTSDQMDLYLQENYPFNNVYIDIHHYETLDGLITDPIAVMVTKQFNSPEEAINYEPLIGISIYDHEMKRNDAKRKIKLIDPDYIINVINQFNSIMRS